MRRGLIAFTTLLAASTVAFGSQVPLGRPAAMRDPSFPQTGLFDDKPIHHGSTAGATLAEALTIDRKAGVWWDYARDVASITARLSAQGAKDTTILVPIDSAIMRLPRKPHQSPEGKDTEETMRQNVEDFLSAHVIPGSIDMPTTKPVQTLLDGVEIEVLTDENNAGGWRIQPGDIQVVGVKEASNGRILYLDGVITK